MTPSQPRDRGQLPQVKRTELARAKRLEWLTLGLRISVVAALGLVLGSAQALTAVWLKSLWSLLPPLAFLVAARVERRAPTLRFPYGFYRASSIGFLTSALALGCMGLYLIYSGARSLIQAKHPALDSFFEHGSLLAWPGWPILAALAYSIAVPVCNGRSRQKLAVDLHDKGLYADATMGRVSWMAGSAAVIGVLGIGCGLWWVDYLATFAIGADILRHGFRHLYTAVCDLIDEVPRRLGSNRVDPLGQEIRDYLETLWWVAKARVRLREEGRMLTGVALVCPTRNTALLDEFEAARAAIEDLDWRLLDFELVPISETTFQRVCRERLY